jgi:GntR family transcriptional regulator
MTRLYEAVAEKLTAEILAGTYPPGSALPSEAELMAHHKVGRGTIRAAVELLRTSGLVITAQGARTQVVGTKGPQEASTGTRRTITETADGYDFGGDWVSIEAPTVTRGHLTGTVARLLAAEDEAALVVDRLLGQPETTHRATQRLWVPFATLESVPGVAASPDMPVGQVYAALRAAHGQLTWADHITARTPTPDVASTLRSSIGDALLIACRVTLASDGRPLVCEEMCVPSSATALIYPVRVTPQAIG